eukprot:4804509-Karenia_brevis.AAC.1
MLEVDDMDAAKSQELLTKVHNYIRSMSPGQARMDIGNFEHAPTAPTSEKTEDATTESPKKEWLPAPTCEEYLNYI